MNLINLYIQEVARRLPDKNRNDIALELESTIYDMLPENYTEENVHQALEKLGNPAILASKYSEKPMHLIGPKYYDVYVSLFKLILPIALLISLIIIVAVNFARPVEDGAVLETLLTVLGEGIWHVITVFIQIFFWLTLTFAFIERVDGMKNDVPLSMRSKPWTPDDLKHVTDVPKKKSIPTCELYASLGWTAIWGTTYFYADHLLGVYEKGENGLRMVTAAFNQDVLMSFWPWIVLLIGAEIALAIFKMIKKQWTYRLAALFTLYKTVSIGIFILILMHSNLFRFEFLTYVSDLFHTTPTIIANSLVWGSISVLVVHAAIAIGDVYRKARIKTGGNSQEG